MTKVLKEIISLLSVFSLFLPPSLTVVWAQEILPSKTIGKSEKNDTLDDLTLPSELGDFKLREGGAVYYSPTIKNKILIPVYFWGEIGKTGLHYIPAGTNFVKGLSLAGGPSGLADLSTIKVYRYENEKKMEIFEFDLNDASKEQQIHEFELKPSDVVRIEKDNFYEDRSYYTSLIGIGVTVLSGILTYQTIKDNK